MAGSFDVERILRKDLVNPEFSYSSNFTLSSGEKFRAERYKLIEQTSPTFGRGATAASINYLFNADKEIRVQNSVSSLTHQRLTKKFGAGDWDLIQPTDILVDNDVFDKDTT